MTPESPAASASVTAPMRILVNGEPRECSPGTTVGALLTELGYPTGAVAVERNREVVPRRAHATTELLPGDEVEVVTFVGGG